MKYSAVLTIIIGLCLLSGCKGRQAGVPVLSVSIEPQRYLLERIAGPGWKVNTVLSKGADPENFDPAMSTLVRTAQSEVYFTIGAGAFEESLAERLAEASPGLRFSDSSAGVPRLHGTHDCDGSHGHHDGTTDDEGDADPHIWTSVANMKIVAANMARVLCEIDSAQAGAYKENLRALNLSLDSLDSRIQAEMARNNSQAFMVEHPSLSYFAHDYGLEQIALGGEGKELSASAIRRGIDHGRADGATVFFTEPQSGSGRVGQIIKALAGKEVSINTLAYDWPDELMKIAQALSSR